MGENGSAWLQNVNQSSGTWNVRCYQTYGCEKLGVLIAIDPNTHDMMTVLDEEEFVASAIVYPGSTEEVQAVVRWANEYLIPIFPISMGRNCTQKSFLIINYCGQAETDDSFSGIRWSCSSCSWFRDSGPGPANEQDPGNQS